MPKKLLCWALALALSLAPGCSTNARFTYPLKPPIKVASKTPIDAKIAVLPAVDKRGSTNTTAPLFLAYIPLMPWGWIEHERPEAARQFLSIGEFQADLREDIPKAIAQHWGEAGIARVVSFDQGLLADYADYKLKTTLNKTTYYGRSISYCLSFFAGYIHIFGMPSGSFNVRTDIDLILEDKSGKEVWGGKIKDDHFMWASIYYNYGADMEGLALSLQKGLEALAPEVVEALAARRSGRPGTEPAAKAKRKYYP